ncbi:protein stum homolog isoform X2 [Tachysurus ichikawai]
MAEWGLFNVTVSTFISAFTVLCGARTDLPDRHVCCVFWLNIAAAFIQIITAVVMVGWIMSIFWGMDMVILASYKEQTAGQQL